MNTTTKLVNMEHVIGDMIYEHGIPYMSFDNLVILGQKAVIVFELQENARRISFDEMCSYIKQYISTPFGANEMRKLFLQ